MEQGSKKVRTRFARHLREWQTVLRENGDTITWRTWMKMLRALWTGRVSAKVWRQRARVCARCPLFDRELRRCAGPWVQGKPTGCGCYLPYLLHTKRPYPKGCWGRTFIGEHFGWL